MKPLEQVLSPVIINRNSFADTVYEQKEQLIHKINKLKIDIINNRQPSYPLDFIRPEITNSWIRSKNHGVESSKFNAPVLDKHSIKQVLNKNQYLTKAAAPYIHRLANILKSTGCYVMLTDAEGTILQVVCRDKKTIQSYQLEVGAIWNEETIGTCSHGLSLLLKTPIQTWGPEHYSQILFQSTGSSSPIFDVFDNLAGTLTIVSDKDFHQSAHTFGLVLSIAWILQNEFQLLSKNAVLSATFETADDALITINNNGIISQANLKAYQLLNCKSNNLIGIPIENVFGNLPVINFVLETGKPVYDTEIQIGHTDLRVNLHSVHPVKDYIGNKYGYVLRLKKIANKTFAKSNDSGVHFSFDRVIASSLEMEKTVKLAKHFATSDVNILIQGESGTGKEVFAQAIHNNSRPNGPFMAINCAAIPHSLIESELFGYEGGTFTGAERNGKRGKIELASGGTLFLDEIGDMPLDVQPVLLRILEEKRVMRLGSSKYTPVDFRLIAATNKNLRELVSQNKFRLDLYYRLSIFKITIPPLRERGDDIINLAQHFINSAATKYQVPAPYLSDTAKFKLLNYTWPGNVRQLENTMLYAVYVSKNGIIWPEDLPDDISTTSMEITDDSVIKTVVKDRVILPIQEIEKVSIRDTLLQTGNNIRETAKLLGISKSTLYRKIREYQLLDI